MSNAVHQNSFVLCWFLPLVIIQPDLRCNDSSLHWEFAEVSNDVVKKHNGGLFLEQIIPTLTDDGR